MNRALVSLMLAVLLVIVAANLAYRAKTSEASQPGNEAWSTNRMELVAWNDEHWTVWVHAGNFELIPENSGQWHRHSSASVAFVGWEGEPWQAKIDGGEFLLARKGDWAGDVQRSDAIRYRDWGGNNQLRTIADLER